MSREKSQVPLNTANAKVAGDNHLLLAEPCGLGTAELSRCGVAIQDAVYPYPFKRDV